MVNFQQKDFYDIEDLQKIVELLRSKDGCPWDKEQTHKSIRSDFIEEVCEAIEAIDLEDSELLREELGDVLLQVVFHCQIERESENFVFNDVCDEVCKKLIIRHPHVFGDVIVGNTEDVLKNWDSIKKETKGQESYTDTLKSVAKSLPALMRAQKVGKRAAKSGMDFKDLKDALEGLKSEIIELEEAINSGDQANISEELGDVLFSCTNVARKADLDSEMLLTDATEKFIKRFSKTEELIRQKEIDMTSLSIEELDAFWKKAKAQF